MWLYVGVRIVVLSNSSVVKLTLNVLNIYMNSLTLVLVGLAPGLLIPDSLTLSLSARLTRSYRIRPEKEERSVPKLRIMDHVKSYTDIFHSKHASK